MVDTIVQLLFVYGFGVITGVDAIEVISERHGTQRKWF
jgi:hypothetical protein